MYWFALVLSAILPNETSKLNWDNAKDALFYSALEQGKSVANLAQPDSWVDPELRNFFLLLVWANFYLQNAPNICSLRSNSFALLSSFGGES